jgi:hypothetical protein
MLRQAFQAKDGKFGWIGQFSLPVPNQSNSGEKKSIFTSQHETAGIDKTPLKRKNKR